ncbi:FecR domain-containing protein [Olivibacter sp. SDN3]|uniref:FecR family protein n=1 Tax=Olivibacter sp. SDN3 TaxID=2764720 RepID=UPI001651AFD4|nr:FecR family protein [Olivibacter sp. SDN3]QNL51911.1 FecR domain-containing protein [Olivibacter sp. SDN3]
MKQDHKIDELIVKLSTGTITNQELEELVHWYNHFDDTEVVVPSGTGDDADQLKTRMYQRLLEQIGMQSHPKRFGVRRLWPYVAAAAVILLLIGLRVFRDDSNVGHPIDAAKVADIQPGGNRATLSLSDGRVIDLSEAQEGIVIGNELRYRDGSVVFGAGARKLEGQDPGACAGSRTAHYAILRTPKGGIYQITLSDGTKVWLNSASTLKYPVHFQGDERVVELEGEAYFDVRQQPLAFKVLSQHQTIEVMGTEFNVSAYAGDIDIKTTLVRGKVKVASGNEFSVLQPGQRSIIGAEGTHIHVQKVDVGPYTAWKNGQFHFQRTPLTEIMKQISRWYDVEVEYRNEIPQETFSGKMNRDVSLKGVLNIFQVSTIDVRLEDKKLIVNGK